MSEPPIIPDDDPGPVVSGWNDSPVAGDRVDLHMGPIIAGDPEGARVEVTETGLRAFDATGTETASIAGEEGVFVGGEFRTSDALPGQVRLADDGYVTSADGGGVFPGIGITPLDDTDMLYPAGVGPGVNGLTIYGGKRTTGGTSVVQANPDGAFLRTFREDGSAAGEMQTNSAGSYMRTYREDGTAGGAIQSSPTDSRMRTYSGNSEESGWVRVQPQDAELAYVAPNNTYFSHIKADASEAFIFTRAGGTNRYLSVDADGVWVKTSKGGSWKQYNLEETAQDSGWQSVTVGSGITPSASFAWRNKGGIIWWRGTVTATWAAGWNVVATDLPAAIRPAYAYTVNEAGTAAGVLIRVEVDGQLRLYTPAAGTSTHRVTSLSYPVG